VPGQGRTSQRDEADDLIKGEERRFHQGPRVTTLNFEAGYMLAVFSTNVVSGSLATRAGSIYDRAFLYQSKRDWNTERTV
jgi:hypothetical protein